jgi:hypothetical protein
MFNGICLASVRDDLQKENCRAAILAANKKKRRRKSPPYNHGPLIVTPLPASDARGNRR